MIFKFFNWCFEKLIIKRTEEQKKESRKRFKDLLVSMGYGFGKGVASELKNDN